MAQKVKEWITVNGQHVPIMEGESKKDAVNKAIHNQQKVKDDEDKKHRQIEANKKEQEIRYKYFQGKKVTEEEFNKLVTQNAIKSRQDNVRDAKELIPKDSYTQKPTYIQTSKALSAASKEKQEISKKYLQASKELEEARDRHLDPEAVKYLSKREARVLVNDKDYPDTAQAAEKVNKLYTRDRQLSEDIEMNRSLLDRWDKREAENQRQAYGRPEFKEAKGEYAGFKRAESTTTNIDRALQEGKAKVVEMTPKQYIQECAHYIFKDSTVEKTLRGRIGGDDSDINKYAKMMREGTKFDTPYLNYRDEGQEGLHRAVAAYINGIEKIPVIILGKRR